MLNLLLLGACAAVAQVRTPPRGWSSWYSFGGGVTQAKMEATFEKLTNRSAVKGATTSLHDHGYVFANLDDGKRKRV